jgi:hypothetical protein
MIKATMYVIVALTISVSVQAQTTVSTNPADKLALIITPRDLVAKNRAAIVQVIVDITQPAGDIAHVKGSGFIISSDGMIVTAAHLLSGYKDAQSTPIHIKIGTIYTNDILPAEPVKGPPYEGGVVVLKLPDPENFGRSGFTAVERGSARIHEIGDVVYVMGFPLTGNLSFKRGEIAAKDGGGGMLLWQVTAPLNYGDSGAPVFDDTGKVIGVVSGGAPGAQGFNFIWPENLFDSFGVPGSWAYKQEASLKTQPVITASADVNQLQAQLGDAIRNAQQQLQALTDAQATQQQQANAVAKTKEELAAEKAKGVTSRPWMVDQLNEELKKRREQFDKTAYLLQSAQQKYAEVQATTQEIQENLSAKMASSTAATTEQVITKTTEARAPATGASLPGEKFNCGQGPTCARLSVELPAGARVIDATREFKESGSPDWIRGDSCSGAIGWCDGLSQPLRTQWKAKSILYIPF